MTPDAVETVLKRLRNARRALVAVQLLGPALLFGLVEVMAYRRVIASTTFWVFFVLLSGTSVALTIWAVTSYCSLSSKNDKGEVTETHRWQSPWIWASLIFSIALAFGPGDGPFCAWPRVNATVVCRMLVFPAIGVYLLALGFRRMVADNERRGFPPKVFIPITSKILFVCTSLTIVAGAVGGIIMVGINLRAGQTLSPFGGSRKVFLGRSPEAFWTFTEVTVFIVLMMLALGVFGLCANLLDVWKKRTNSSEPLIISVSACGYAAILFVLGWYIAKSALGEH